MARMTGGKAVIRSVLAHGVDTLFALPGVQMDHFFNAVHDEGNKVRVFQTRHEQGAAYMALGYAQASNKAGVYAVVPGPGMLNAAAALSTAYATGSPVMALCGQIPGPAIGKDLGMLHEIPDQLGTLKGLTKYAARINHPAEASNIVNQAFSQMKSGYVRPVAVEVPMDVLAQETEVEIAAPLGPEAPPPLDEDAINAAAKILGQAKNPLIVVGGGVRNATIELLQLAEALQAPVVMNRVGRGMVSDEHYLGHTSATGFELWDKADVVLGLATRMQNPRMNWGRKPDRKIILVDIDATKFTRIERPALGIMGDVKEVLGGLLPALEKHNTVRSNRQNELTQMKIATTADLRTKLGPQMAYLDVLRSALSGEDIYVDELTQVSYPARIAYPVYQPNTMITSGYQGTLGYGYATALGAQVAKPDNRVLAVSGDGGFFYNVQEIATAVLHNIPVVVVVFVDGHFGNVRRMQEELHGGRVIATELHNPDLVAMAKSFGAQGLEADSPETLAPVLEEAFASKAPTVIQVKVGDFPDPWPHIMRTR